MWNRLLSVQQGPCQKICYLQWLSSRPEPFQYQNGHTAWSKQIKDSGPSCTVKGLEENERMFKSPFTFVKALDCTGWARTSSLPWCSGPLFGGPKYATINRRPGRSLYSVTRLLIALAPEKLVEALQTIVACLESEHWGPGCFPWVLG